MIRRIVGITTIFVLTGCASVPNAVVQYYPPKARLVVTVTQAVDCNADKSALVTSNSVADVITYSADLSAGVRKFKVKPPTGAISDTNITFNLTEDGRLKGVNGDSTGQAEAFAKAVITMAAAVIPLLGGGAAPPGQLAECAAIASWGGGKPVTLSYVQDVPFANGVASPTYILAPDPGSQPLYDKLRAHLPNLVLTVGAPAPIERPVFLNEGAEAGPKLVLNRIASVHLALAEGVAQPGWSTDVIVPLTSTYDVPLPSAAAFGKVNFALVLADSGAVTTLTYGQVSGASGPANVATAAAAAARPDSAGDRAAALKAEADEIAQNARVARCRADPSNCT